MTLRAKLTSLVALNTLVVLALLVAASTYVIRSAAFEETGARALAVARTVATLPAVVDAFATPDPSAIIQPLAEQLRAATQAEFIVVGSMDLIRYSHPRAAELGKRMVGEDDEAVLHGRESVTRASGTLGLSVRGKVPVLDRSGRQIGVVSTGFLVQGVERRVHGMVREVALACGVALLLGLAGAWLLSGHFKRQILGMEPEKIAFTTREQAAILDAIREGVLAVNAAGRVVTCNPEARKLLGLGDGEVVGKELSEVLPSSALPEILRTGTPQYDQPLVVGESLLQANRVPVRLEGRVIGAVATFRDKLLLDALDARLADVGRYVEELRSQRHEFMNRLHLILGLLHTSDYAAAQEVIERVNDEYQRSLDFYMARIRDPAVVGILIGKAHQARELGVELAVSSDSSVSRPCPHRDAVVTVLGNAVSNALEALRAAPAPPQRPEVRVSIREEPDRLVVEVRDNGPGVDPARAAAPFEAGVTTKGPGRGLGLAIVARLVAAAGGEVALESTGTGAVFRATLPREGAA